MKFAEWVDGVAPEIRNDPIWKLDVFQLGMLASEVAGRDAQVLERNLRMRSAADRLRSVAAAISVNLREGGSRGDAADRSRFYAYALDSAHECREWYETARNSLPEAVIKHRLELIASIVDMINSSMPDQRTRPTQEAGDESGITAKSRRTLFDEHIPFA